MIDEVRALAHAEAVRKFATKILIEDGGGCLIFPSKPKSHGYGQINGFGRGFRPHRVAFAIQHGPIPDGMEIDHTCHNKMCVNVDHLRLATRKQNSENRSGARSGSLTGVRGVTYDRSKRRYIASVKHNGRQIYLGGFESAQEAGRVAKAKRLELFTHNDVDRVMAS